LMPSYFFFFYSVGNVLFDASRFAGLADFGYKPRCVPDPAIGCTLRFLTCQLLRFQTKRPGKSPGRYPVTIYLY
jgi:hypothetical protein